MCVFVLVLANSKEMNFKCQMGYWSESPIGPLPSATHPDTMEIARTGNRQMGAQTSLFRASVCVAVCVCVHVEVFDDISASLMNTILADVRLSQVGEPKERCSAPAERRCSLISLQRVRPSLSTSLFPLSECAPIFPHHHFSTLLYPPPPPALPHTLAACLRSIFPLHPL